jgi:hypothetical protein
MAEFDHGIKMIAETTGRQLARLAGVECRRWQPVESTLQVSTERLADRVFQGKQGRERFLVYFEFYTTWDRDAPWEMLGKSGLLSQREKLPTRCIAVVLRQQGFRSVHGNLRLEAGGEPTQELWFKEVCLWRITPQSWWEDELGLMALYPLCQHGQQPREAITHAMEVIERKVTGPVERANALALLDIFGGLAYPKLNVERIIGSEKMKESRLWREAREEGELLRQRANIVRVLRTRFGAEAVAAIPAALDQIPDLAQLEPLLDRAVTCPSPEEFLAALPREGVQT